MIGYNLIAEMTNLENPYKMPKICGVLTGENQEEMKRQLALVKQDKPDLLEWRCDLCRDIMDSTSIIQWLDMLETRINGIPLVFTYRQEKPGKIPDYRQYVKWNQIAMESGKVQIVDLELDCPREIQKELLEIARENKLPIILSKHDFINDYTDETRLEWNRLWDKGKELLRPGEGILKLAVSPKSVEKVVAFMSDTREIADKARDLPVIGIAMGQIGTMSRVLGEITGSCMTYSCIETDKGLGQLTTRQIRDLHEIVDNFCKNQYFRQKSEDKL